MQKSERIISIIGLELIGIVMFTKAETYIKYLTLLILMISRICYYILNITIRKIEKERNDKMVMEETEDSEFAKLGDRYIKYGSRKFEMLLDYGYKLKLKKSK